MGYLHRPDTILVQMLELSGDPKPEAGDRVATPEFTLYGDGTLLIVRRSADGQPALLQARLSEEAIEELLTFIVEEGFLDFRYRHTSEDAASDAATTYLYVNTSGRVNATRVEGLDGGAPESDADEFRSIAEIARRLRELDPEELGGRYEHEEVALFVQPLRLFEGEAPTWPVEAIDLASLAPEDSGVNKKILRLEDTGGLLEELAAGDWGRYGQGERTFALGYRPLLPFEEHFPEFDFSPTTMR